MQMVEGHQLQRHEHLTQTANGASFSLQRMKGKPTILPRKMIKDKVLKLPRDKDYLRETHKYMKVFMPQEHVEILESTDKTVANEQLLKWMQKMNYLKGEIMKGTENAMWEQAAKIARQNDVRRPSDGQHCSTKLDILAYFKHSDSYSEKKIKLTAKLLYQIKYGMMEEKYAEWFTNAQMKFQNKYNIVFDESSESGSNKKGNSFRDNARRQQQNMQKLIERNEVMGSGGLIVKKSGKNKKHCVPLINGVDGNRGVCLRLKDNLTEKEVKEALSILQLNSDTASKLLSKMQVKASERENQGEESSPFWEQELRDFIKKKIKINNKRAYEIFLQEYNR